MLHVVWHFLLGNSRYLGRFYSVFILEHPVAETQLQTRESNHSITRNFFLVLSIFGLLKCISFPLNVGIRKIYRENVSRVQLQLKIHDISNIERGASFPTLQSRIFFLQSKFDLDLRYSTRDVEDFPAVCSGHLIAKSKLFFHLFHGINIWMQAAEQDWQKKCLIYTSLTFKLRPTGIIEILRYL